MFGFLLLFFLYFNNYRFKKYILINYNFVVVKLAFPGQLQMALCHICCTKLYATRFMEKCVMNVFHFTQSHHLK